MENTYRVTEDSAKECLIGVHFAPAQQLSVLINEAVMPDDESVLGDWIVLGVFENEQQYQGPLSGLGIRLEEGLVGLVDLKSIAGFRPLMPEAYVALNAMKDQAPGSSEIIQPWTRWISFALENDVNTTLQDADAAWLDSTFSRHHCSHIRGYE
ncbi:hypothetical protein [Pseudomonas aeruginosa]|uniref:hypothetical protein n=1 Tax=Pseudomonas aeruginosa TaxID=287 RepID=UPI00155E336B|nr:hypothetical protein [Pseudomonas aeruginosa]NRC34037.1 hypothetical protein [Pseudomonas aeruginosa]